MAMAAAAAAAATAAATTSATFRSLLHPTSTPLPPRLRFQPHPLRLHLHLSPPSPPHHPPLLASASSSTAEAFSSDGEEEYEEQEEVEVEDEEEEPNEEEFTAELPAPRASPTPRTRPPRGEEPGRLFVGNLPYSMTSSDLADTFSEAGTVEDVQVIYDRVTDRSRGFAFVTMATAEEASKAIEMFDAALLGGRTVKVNFPEVPRGGERAVAPAAISRGGGGGRFDDGAYKIYAGNLGWGVRADALKAAFGAQPGLLGARVIFDRETGRSRGFGFVSFQTAEDAQAAMEAMDGVELEGRPLRLSPAAGNPPAGSPPSTDSQMQQDESIAESSDPEIEESNLQATASY